MKYIEMKRAMEDKLGGTPPPREIHRLLEQTTGCHSKATDRAMLRLMVILRRIAESNIGEDTEVAA